MRVRTRLALAAAAVAAAFVVGAGLIVASGLHDRVARSDVAIVLGSNILKSGAPSPRLAARVERAVQLYRAGTVPLIIVSGGYEAGRGDEAEVMRRYAISRGVPDTAILTDSHGDNTLATARNGVAVMRARGLTRAIVVSQYFHIARARMALKACGAPTVYSAHPDFFEWRDLLSVPREVVAYPVYWLKGC